MEMVLDDMEWKNGTSIQWLSEFCTAEPQEIVKHTQTTRAWYARVNEQDVFIKGYPAELRASWASVEAAIAGASLHSAIVPLRQTVNCSDGVLLIYDRVKGESLAPQDVRARFSALPLTERCAAVLDTCEALAAICEAGFTIVDWYDGNMIYDFDAKKIWLFDWDLCRDADSFCLEMDFNYGSSKLMAPEEFVRGSRIDQTTTVFNLGRYALLILPELAEPLALILARATYPGRGGRYQKVCDFVIALGMAIPPVLADLSRS